MIRSVRFLLWAGSILAVLWGMPGCGRGRVEAAPSADHPRVAVAKVARGHVAETLAVTAEFKPYQEIDVHAKVAGYVDRILVDVGDRVQAGQLLAVLESPELQDEALQDEAAARRAQAEIDRAEADLQRAESQHDVAHANALRLSGVLKARPHLVAQQDVDEATGRDRSAEADVATAKAAIVAAKDQLDVAKATAEKTQALVAYLRITAPFTGVVTERYADTGAMVQAGTSSQTQTMPLVRLSQNSTLRLVIPLPESAVASVRVGTSVALNVSALHKTFQGTVSRLADRLDTNTRTMHVEVQVPNPSLQIVPGMYADASLVLADAKNALVVPVEAIDRTTTPPSVLVVGADNRIAARTVTLGLESGSLAQIVTGISEGDQVVTGSRSQLRVGDLVSPAIVAAAPSAGGPR